jgi:hypothetical protein
MERRRSFVNVIRTSKDGTMQSGAALDPSNLTVETDDEDDEVDETRGFGSGWRGLGIERLLVVAVVLVLLISAASPSEQTPVPPAPAKPESRTVAVFKPVWPAEAPPIYTGNSGTRTAYKRDRKGASQGSGTEPAPEIKRPQEAAPPSPAFPVATAIYGLEARASEVQPKTEGANQTLILKGADQAFEKSFAEGFIRQSCLVRDPRQKAEQLGEKIKEAEEKRDKSREQLETRVETSSSPVSGQKQGNKATPVTESESERERLKATVQEQQSLMLTLSAERQRIEAEKIAAEQTLNERLKERKLAHDCEPLQEKRASGNNIDEPSAQPPAHAGPLASVKKSVALKCSDILSRLQLGESSRSDLDALRQCKLR